MTVRLFSFTYFLGLAIFILVILAVLLAAFGIQTVGRSVPLVYPITVSVILIATSKLAIGLALRRAEKHHG